MGDAKEHLRNSFEFSQGIFALGVEVYPAHGQGVLHAHVYRGSLEGRRYG